VVKELWKPFRHGYYEVSNLGRVRRVKASKGAVSGKMLKSATDKKGYLHLVTYYHGRAKGHLVHVLVANAFLGPCPTGKEVNHKDLDKGNCVWDNLEYLTRLKNCHHAIKAGVKYGKSKLTYYQAREIRRLFATGKYHKRSKTLGNKFGVHSDTIWKVLANKTWKKAA
jgi:hypothetical protein